MAEGKRYFTPVYDDIAAIETLGPGPKQLYSLLVRLLGDEEDGRRRDPRKETPYIQPTQSYLAQRLGASRDEIQSWSERLKDPHACAWCGYAHALLVTSRPYPGAKTGYRLVKCRDVAASQRLPIVPRAKRAVVRPQDRATKAQLSLGVGSATAEEACGKTPHARQEVGARPALGDAARGKSPHASAGLSRRALMLQLVAEEMHGVSVPGEMLEVIAEQEAFDAGELEQLLIRVLSAASIERVPLTVELAQRVLEGAGDAEGREGDSHGSDRAALLAEEHAEQVRMPDGIPGRLLLLARRREPGTTPAAMERLYTAEIYPACMRHVDGDRRAAEALALELVEDPRVARAPNPVGTLRLGVREGWLLRPAWQDDGTGALERAYQRLPAGARAAAEELLREHSRGAALPREKLRALGVSSSGMIAMVKRRIEH
ncbi:hypothetical protein EPN44_14345 [bacterium]|nr:MAG: hypothetical protein EPN44_14345 [bacterium]